MSRVVARYRTEDLAVDFETKTFTNNLGVPRSDFEDIDLDNVEVISLSILDLDVSIDDLPADLQDAIYELAASCQFNPEEE